MKNHGKKMAALMCLALFLGMSLFPGASADSNVKYENDKIELKTGSTDILDGGDFVYIEFKNDAGFGVLYGNKTNPNSIIILAWHTRYLGGADLYLEDNTLVGRRIPIPVITVFAQKLEDIFEFNDTDQDGIADYKRMGSGLSYYDYPWHEPIYKAVSLETAWNRSKVTEVTEPNANKRTWEFSLSATNLSYVAIGDSATIKDQVNNEVLDRVEFTFNLTAGMMKIENQSIPYYKVIVRKEARQGFQKGYTVMEAKRVENRLVSGRRGVYDVKYDHEIEGWDFDPTNENRMLLLEWHAIMGNVIPKNVAEWIQVQLLKRIEGYGKAVYETDEGMKEASEDDAVNGTGLIQGEPQKLKFRYVRCAGNWENIGNLTWVSNVNVDGQEREMYAQIQGHVKFMAKGPMGNVFAGFAMLGGFSYPGGSMIVHDPSIGSDSLIEMSLATSLCGDDCGIVPPFMWIVFVGVAVVLVITVFAISRARKGKKEDYFGGSYESYEPPRETPPENEGWQRYYGKR